MTHPTPETLVPLALGERDPVIERHVVGCAACTAEVARLREAASLYRGPASLDSPLETPECLDERSTADFVDGTLADEARAAAVAHLLSCARCRLVVSATGRLVADPQVQRETPGAAPPSDERRRRRWVLPVGIAAAAALALLVWPRGVDDGAPGLREPGITASVAPQLIAPRDAVARVDRLVWSSVPRADRYRLRLYDAEGNVVWRVETTDTFATLPDSVRLSAQAPYFWRVEAQTEWQRWAVSDLVEFRVTGPLR